MALLLNRKYGSRLECLYYILTSCYKKFGTTERFSLKDLKFDPYDEYNVHNYCKQLKNTLGRQCCPYLNNPLNLSKCYATQSVDSDSTKSKAVSDIGGSLESLGFITRVSKGNYLISTKGESWVKSSYDSQEWVTIALSGVLSYGVTIGFLNKINDLSDEFSYQGIYLSYPQTTEIVEHTDSDGITSNINISTDSQKDSNTRTISRIIGWCVAVGLIEPKGVTPSVSDFAHIKYQDFLNKGELTIRKFKKTAICKSLFDSKRTIDNPLSYSRLHKNVGSLRENGGADLRKVTLKYNNNILDRRFVFVYALNYYSKQNKPLDFEKLVCAMQLYPERFFSKGNDALAIMESECEIADITGIPFDMKAGNLLYAKSIINEKILTEDAPSNSVELAKQVILEMEKIYDL